MQDLFFLLTLCACIGCVYFAFKYFSCKRSMDAQTVGRLRIIFEEDEDQPHVFLELQDNSVFNQKTKKVILEVTHEKPTL